MQVLLHSAIVNPTRYGVYIYIMATDTHLKFEFSPGCASYAWITDKLVLRLLPEYIHSTWLHLGFALYSGYTILAYALIHIIYLSAMCSCYRGLATLAKNSISIQIPQVTQHKYQNPLMLSGPYNVQSVLHPPAVII